MIKKIKSLFHHHEADSFKTKVKKGVFWTLGISVWTRGLGIISSVVITRILNPEDFGLMAIATSIVTIITGITATGFNTAIIQKQISPEILLNSAWTMEAFKGVILFFLVFITAPFISNYFEEERLILMLKVLSISFLIKGFENVGTIWFRKNLDIRKEFLFGAIPDLFYLIIVVVLALILRSVWALIIGTVIAAIIKTIVSFFIHPFRPKVEFNLKHFKELFGFGKWILGGSILVMIRNQGVSLFVGKIFNVGILGDYNRGEVFSKKIFDEISKTLWKVGYPAFSNLSLDLPKYKKVFLIALKMITTIGFPMIGGLYVLSPELARYVLSEKWISIVPLIQLFALGAIPGFIQTPFGISFQSLGIPSVGTKIAFVNLIVFLGIAWPLSIYFGVKGFILASLFANMLILPIGWVKMTRILKINVREFFISIIPQFVFSIAMSLSIFILRQSLFKIDSILDLIAYIAFGVCFYFVLLLISDKYFKTDYRKMLNIFIK